jgi:TPP-dependent 2-oxoacid decarboxylase
VKWIGCSNELNASYAADGYARVRGAAMLVTTYGVGELSALNGVMGAKAEKALVFHVVGMPSYQHQRLGKIAHHTLGDGVFGNFVNLSAGAACCHAVISPENCVIEMERAPSSASAFKSSRLWTFFQKVFAHSATSKSAAINLAFWRSTNASRVPYSSTTHLTANVLHEAEPPRASVFAVLSASVGRRLTCQKKAQRRR